MPESATLRQLPFGGIPIILLAAILSLSASAQVGPRPQCLDGASIRKYVAEQDTAWNARDFARFYSLFAPDARMVVVTRENGRELRQSHSLAEDRRQSEAFFAKHGTGISETDEILNVAIVPDCRHADVTVRETTNIRVHGKTRTLRAITRQTLTIRGDHVVSLGLVEIDQ